MIARAPPFSTSSAFSMRLDEMTLETLRSAIDRYLACAYPDATPPQDVVQRLRVLEAPSLPDALSAEEIERESDPGTGPMRYAIRLGSSSYPHVKVALERCSRTDSFVLTVDTHDRHFLLPPGLPEASRARFEAIQDANRRLKEHVEAEWTAAGLPTFRRYIQEGLAERR